MSKAKRWTPKCDNAAVLAKAILSGVVTDDLQTFKDFFDPHLGGLGADIGDKYHYHTTRGVRNLKRNYQNLLRKITIWKTNKPDPATGKRKSIESYKFCLLEISSSFDVLFSYSFLRKIQAESRVSRKTRDCF